MAKATRTTESASPVLPFGSSGAVDLTAQANATPPATSATERPPSAQASQAVVRRLILAPSVTTLLYRTTISQGLRQGLVTRGSELPRTPSRNCPKRGASDAPGVYLAPLSGPKRAGQAGLGALWARVSGASGSFRTVSGRSSESNSLAVGRLALMTEEGRPTGITHEDVIGAAQHGGM